MGEARAACVVTLEFVVPDIRAGLPNRKASTTMIDEGVWGLVSGLASLRSRNYESALFCQGLVQACWPAQ